MNLKADLILHDCCFAINRYDYSAQGEELRVSWWTIVSLLRAVGHILKYVDSNLSPIHKQVINDEFGKLLATKPHPEIFWQFIVSERNNFIKEYRYGFERKFKVVTKQDGQDVNVKFGMDDLINMSFDLENENSHITSIIKSGPFKGQSEGDVAWMAYHFWAAYILNIKKEIASKTPK